MKLVEKGVLKSAQKSAGTCYALDGEEGAEAPAFSLGSTDLIVRLQTGVDSEDLKLALRLNEVELQTKNRFPLSLCISA